MKNMKEKLNYYMNLSYTIEIFQNKDGSYFAKIKELEGCMTEGNSLEEVKMSIEDAKREWIKSMLEEDSEIPLPENK